MHDDMSIDDAFFYYFYLEEMQRHEADVDHHLPDDLTLQQFRERMKQNRDERYYA